MYDLQQARLSVSLFLFFCATFGPLPWYFLPTFPASERGAYLFGATRRCPRSAASADPVFALFSPQFFDPSTRKEAIRDDALKQNQAETASNWTVDGRAGRYLRVPPKTPADYL